MVNPATSEVVTTLPFGVPAEVDRAVAAAHAAAPAWAALTRGERSDLLQRVADAVAAQLDQLRDLEVLDAGKPVTAATDDEFPLVLGSLRYFLGAARSLTTPGRGQYLPGVTTMFQREPYGVVAAITPWNYPLWLAVWKTIPALVTGNTVVVKPAENTPLRPPASSRWPRRCCRPVCSTWSTDAAQRRPTSRHPDVDLVSFTGSVATGRAIAAAGAARPRRSVLELGGNAPVVVLAGRRPRPRPRRRSPPWHLQRRPGVHGRHAVLVRAGGRRVVGAARRGAGRGGAGRSDGPATTLGPVISEPAAGPRRGLVGPPAHAEGGHRRQSADRPGFFFEPTVITGLEQDDELVQQEIFGPVVTVQTFSTRRRLAMANDVEFGLSGSVWTENIDAGLD